MYSNTRINKIEERLKERIAELEILNAELIEKNKALETLIADVKEDLITVKEDIIKISLTEPIIKK